MKVQSVLRYSISSGSKDLERLPGGSEPVTRSAMRFFQVLKATGHKVGVKDNGVFWMEWEDYKHGFAEVAVCFDKQDKGRHRAHSQRHVIIPACLWLRNERLSWQALHGHERRSQERALQPPGTHFQSL